MNGFIKIQVLNIDGDDIQYEIKFSSDICTTTLDFYGNGEEFKNFGKALLHFPKNINDTACFQLGEDNKKWAQYMHLKAFCYDSNGHSAIRVIVTNLMTNVHGYRTEFSIFAESWSLNKLGQLLTSWDPTLTQEFYWESNV